jgi:hypothetical protein
MDQELAIRFVRSQIYASEIVQSGLLARWQAHSEQAPSTAPDLQSIRELLDQLDEQLRCMRATHRLASLCRRLRRGAYSGRRAKWTPVSVETRTSHLRFFSSQLRFFRRVRSGRSDATAG